MMANDRACQVYPVARQCLTPLPAVASHDVARGPGHQAYLHRRPLPEGPHRPATRQRKHREPNRARRTRGREQKAVMVHFGRLSPACIVGGIALACSVDTNMELASALSADQPGNGCDERSVRLVANEGLVIDDFDGESNYDNDDCLDNKEPNPNLLGYCSMCFSDCSVCPDPKSGHIESTLTAPEDALWNAGHALELTFDVAGEDRFRYAGYVQWLTCNTVCPDAGMSEAEGTDCPGFDLDRLNLRYLSFWLRTEAGSEDVDLELALKDVNGNESSKLRARDEDYVDAACGEWTKIRVGLDELRTSNVNTAQLQSVSFTFSQGVGDVDQGTVYLDDIGFEGHAR